MSKLKQRAKEQVPLSHVEGVRTNSKTVEITDLLVRANLKSNGDWPNPSELNSSSISLITRPSPRITPNRPNIIDQHR